MRIHIGMKLFACFLIALGLLSIWIRSTTLHPPPIQDEKVICEDTPSVSNMEITPPTSLKVMSWNVQFMAGRNSVFYYDIPDGSGPDERPSADDIRQTLKKVANLILEEKPDILFLQEIDDGAKRTDYQDQLQELLRLLPKKLYPCRAEAFYWKAQFVPHPRILGSAGMKLVTLSRYPIKKATRYQLAIKPDNLLVRQFTLKRAVLETQINVPGASKNWVFLNTHLDAFAQGNDTMERQVAQVKEILDRHSQSQTPWIMGGDFNLLPPGKTYGRLSSREQYYYRPNSELKVLTDSYPSIPSLEDADGPEYQKWVTHTYNDPQIPHSKVIIDFLFYSSSFKVRNKYVIQGEAEKISDHYPVVGEFEFSSSTQD